MRKTQIAINQTNDREIICKKVDKIYSNLLYYPYLHHEAFEFVARHGSFIPDSRPVIVDSIC